MLTVENLHSGYGSIPVLTGLSLSVSQGEFVGILGHNGMGKTTLLKTLIGILPATAGKITFAGNVVTSAPAHRRARAGMGYVPQGRGILPGLTVRDNLLFAAAAVGARRSGQLDEALDDFPRLKAYLDRPGGALSGGEQQLLALARCMMADPWMVLLDEPTEGIQPSIIKDIGRAIRYLRDGAGIAILLVEQYLDFCRELADEVYVMDRGLVVHHGPAGDLDRPEVRRHLTV